MAYLNLIYAYFKVAIEGWSVYEIAALAAVVPLVLAIAQLALYSHVSRFVKAQRRLNRFFKQNSYLSSVNLFLFNKKVTKVFPLRVRKTLKNMEGKEISLEQIVTPFENYRAQRAFNILKIGCIVHLITLSVIMAVNGYSVAAIAFVGLCVALVWWMFAIGCYFAKRLYRIRENKKRGEFLYALSHNVKEVATFSLGSVEDVKTLSDDSVSALAKGVESFLSTNPDKSLAKVVLKSLYSANYTSATSRESVFALKEAMHKLKNYVL